MLIHIHLLIGVFSIGCSVFVLENQNLIETMIGAKTFRVTTSRCGEHHKFTSKEIEFESGGALQETYGAKPQMVDSGVNVSSSRSAKDVDLVVIAISFFLHFICVVLTHSLPVNPCLPVSLCVSISVSL